MRQDTYVSATKLLAITLWTVALSLIAAGWIVLAINLEYRAVAVMLACTGTAASAAAAVAHLRIYHTQMASLLRMTAGLSPDKTADLRSVK